MFKFPNGHTILHTGEIFTDRALCYNLTLWPFLRLFTVATVKRFKQNFSLQILHPGKFTSTRIISFSIFYVLF